MDTLTLVLLILFILATGAIVTLSIFLMKAVARIDFFEKWTEEFLQRTYSAYEELKRIDASGHFEADDEVGYFFKSLKDIMQRLFDMGVTNEEEIERQKEEVKNRIDVEKINEALSKKRVQKEKPKE